MVAVSLIPLLPVAVTWFLPWEDWIPRRVPKAVLGPYLMYVAFATWHLKFGWFVPLLALIGGIVLSALALEERFNR